MYKIYLLSTYYFAFFQTKYNIFAPRNKMKFSFQSLKVFVGRFRLFLGLEDALGN